MPADTQEQTLLLAAHLRRSPCCLPVALYLSPPYPTPTPTWPAPPQAQLCCNSLHSLLYNHADLHPSLESQRIAYLLPTPNEGEWAESAPAWDDLSRQWLHNNWRLEEQVSVHIMRGPAPCCPVPLLLPAVPCNTSSLKCWVARMAWRLGCSPWVISPEAGWQRQH